MKQQVVHTSDSKVRRIAKIYRKLKGGTFLLKTGFETLIFLDAIMQSSDRT